MTNGDTFTVDDMPDNDVLDFVAELQDGSTPTLTVALDATPEDRASLVHLMRARISSVEID